MHITGTNALVTGGASGLGLATVTALAKSGARVIAVDLPTANTDALAALGDTVEFAPADVTDEAAVTEAVERANAESSLRITVNCAGIGNAVKTVGKNGPFPLAEFEKIVKVNLTGTFNVIRLAAHAMSQNEPVDGERGVIVNTASIAAFEGQKGQAAYAASKGGIVGLSLPMARDLAREGIRVMAIAPGLMLTPMLRGLPQEVQDQLAADVTCPRRLGDPAEYAALARFIVECDYLNGDVIRIDGALRMK
jgi:NAD(P)-dependent dehydrogenase (short-subunit alcohol dehydrogenase family)